MHLFKTFVTFVTSLIFFSMSTHVRHGVSLVFIFVGTKVTWVPATILVHFQVMIIVTNTFKTFYHNLVPYIQEHSLFGGPVYVGPGDSEMQTFSHI